MKRLRCQLVENIIFISIVFVVMWIVQHFFSVAFHSIPASFNITGPSNVHHHIATQAIVNTHNFLSPAPPPLYIAPHHKMFKTLLSVRRQQAVESLIMISAYFMSFV